LRAALDSRLATLPATAALDATLGRQRHRFRELTRDALLAEAAQLDRRLDGASHWTLADVDEVVRVGHRLATILPVREVLLTAFDAALSPARRTLRARPGDPRLRPRLFLAPLNSACIPPRSVPAPRCLRSSPPIFPADEIKTFRVPSDSGRSSLPARGRRGGGNTATLGRPLARRRSRPHRRHAACEPALRAPRLAQGGAHGRRHDRARLPRGHASRERKLPRGLDLDRWRPKTFSRAADVLKEFGPGKEYGNSGNMALGLAHDGAVLLLAHGHNKDANHIYGWRSADQGRTWQTVDTAGLGPNKTGSSTGTIVQIPGRKLMVTGHYREGSKPYRLGIWQSTSTDDGRSWGEPRMINNLNAGEPVLVRHENRLLVFIRGRGPAAARQFVSVSEDWGQTWVTDLLNLTPRQPHTTGLAHPFAMVHPHHPAELLAITFERPLPGAAQLWRAPAKTLAFKHERTLVELPKLEGDRNNDFGYAWLLPLEGRRALVFYYHGLGQGPCPIWVLETTL
jgi:hypothetical protein